MIHREVSWFVELHNTQKSDEADYPCQTSSSRPDSGSTASPRELSGLLDIGPAWVRALTETYNSVHDPSDVSNERSGWDDIEPEVETEPIVVEDEALKNDFNWEEA
jgi:hypothetical protein